MKTILVPKADYHFIQNRLAAFGIRIDIHGNLGSDGIILSKNYIMIMLRSDYGDFRPEMPKKQRDRYMFLVLDDIISKAKKELSNKV